MLRNQLSAAVRNAAEKLGYTFSEGFGYRMNEKISSSPPHGGVRQKFVLCVDAMRESSFIESN